MNVHQNARLTPLGRERLVGMIAGGMTFSQPVLSTTLTEAKSTIIKRAPRACHFPFGF